MTKHITARLMVALFATAALAACGKQGGFESLPGATGNTSQGSSDGGNSGQGGTTAPTEPAPPSAYDKMDLNGYVGGGTYENEKVLGIDKANNALLLYLPLPGAFSNLYIDVPQVKGVQIKTVMDSQQKARVAVSIPLRLLVKDRVTTLPATKLPNGNNLPMMPSGELPSLGLGLNPNSDNKVYLYFGVNAVGMFIESSLFPAFLGLTYPLKNAAATRTLGYFTIVPKSGAYNGGLFLSFILPNDLAKIIDDHLSGVIK